MSELKRWMPAGFGLMDRRTFGDYVRFEDAKALQGRLRDHEAALESTEMMNGQQSDQLLEQSKTIHSLTQRLAEAEAERDRLSKGNRMAYSETERVNHGAGEPSEDDLLDILAGVRHFLRLAATKQALSNSEALLEKVECEGVGDNNGFFELSKPKQHSQKHKRDCQKQLNTPYGLGGSDDA